MRNKLIADTVFGFLRLRLLLWKTGIYQLHPISYMQLAFLSTHFLQALLITFIGIFMYLRLKLFLHFFPFSIVM
jgi:hypothetical protein